MSMLDWAKNEVKIASERERKMNETPDGEWDYGAACYESALKAYESLLGDGHSGFSISITKSILNRLIDGLPLTPLTGDDDEWYKKLDACNKISYQNKRCSQVFKYIDKDTGKISYNDMYRFEFVNDDNPDVAYRDRFATHILNEMFPITMPYAPGKPKRVVCHEFLVNPKNGDYDTFAILYIDEGDGSRTSINRYFTETTNSFVEISEEEYRNLIARKFDDCCAIID